MKRKIKIIFVLLNTILIVTNTFADEKPTINPSVLYILSDGNKSYSVDTTMSAPVTGFFYANVSNLGTYTPHYEWRFYLANNQDNPYLIRYDENTEYSFSNTGIHYIVLYAKFISNNDTIEYTRDFWNKNTPLKLTISESKLQMPNAFSPNGDGINDIYKAKNGYQSLTEFHASIFNRWGQKLYEWNDPSGGWDGTYKGKNVAQGVYFVLVKAIGADGIVYNIKKDINLLRGYTQNNTISE